MLALQRRQLDGRLKRLPNMEAPRDGWIRTIREALGMTMTQLAKRMGISPQSLRSLEERERAGTISISKLIKAAEAMDCELKLVLAPKTSLEETVHQQAVRKARQQRNRLLHTMHLESQAEGVSEVLEEERAVDLWKTKRASRLWD
ncbi:MAG: mobile mystery protein A [Gemmatimonadaceae bacterium]|nr:mobile mystery protein A [Gemmatimonadaceae bacterium]